MPKKRLAQIRDVRAVFHIVCEGEKSEPNYLEHYIKDHCQSFRAIQLLRIKANDTYQIAHPGKTDPKSLVKAAIEEQSKSPKGDVFWCVYDREAENVVSSTIHKEALDEADKNGINVCLSNVCFEVWLLLHKQDSCAPYGSYRDLAKRSDLKHYFSNYEKGDNRKYEDPDINHARKVAPRMNARTTSGCPRGTPRYKLNPYTDFHRLLDDIDKFFATYLKR